MKMRFDYEALATKHGVLLHLQSFLDTRKPSPSQETTDLFLGANSQIAFEYIIEFESIMPRRKHIIRHINTQRRRHHARQGFGCCILEHLVPESTVQLSYDHPDLIAELSAE